MTKKLAAYSLLAILTGLLVGFSIMMLPPTLETGPPYAPKLPQDITNALTDGSRTSEQQGGSLLDSYALASQPLNFFPSSLIAIAGLAVALGVYVIVRKRLG